ncbi:MAG: DUF4190 domain-containing protein, partial [Mycobacterium sp.]|nr:DUF4190 domain-containing protein [Mycobacterium sp.]
PPPPPGYAPPPPYGPPYQGGYANQGYPGPPTYPGYPMPPQAGTNSLAVTSLVLSVFGLLPFCGFLFSIAGIVTGAIAMGQVKRTGQDGYGLAVAGLAIGVITLLLAIIMFGLI